MRVDRASRPPPLPLLWALGLPACGTAGSLSAFPTSLEYGEVNFFEDMPDAGYAPTELTLRNSGETDLAPQMSQVDLERLCVLGFDAAPITIGTLSPGSSYVFTVGVCGYDVENGERDTQVSGELRFEADGAEPLVVGWSFTPVVDQGGDSG